MKPKYNKLLTLLMAVIMIMTFSVFVNADMELGDELYEGKTVILSSNDVHGAVDGYAYMKALENEFASRGADVITVDAGDFSQGTTYVSESKGGSAIDMMNLTGYDYATLGNHEFDFGPVAMNQNIDAAQFKILVADLFDKASGEFAYTPSDIYVDEESGLKIGFFGMATPETQTKSIPTNFEKIKFPSRDEIYPIAQEVVDQLKADGADVIVCLAHLGVDAESEPYRSYDLMSEVKGIDMVLDGHSHTVMTAGENGEAIMSTGTKFMNIGVTVIDEASKEIVSNDLYNLRDAVDAPFAGDLTPDADVKAVSDKLMADIDEAYGAPIAESKVLLNGEKGAKDGVYGNRDGETNSGDLITDAIKWYIMKEGTDLGVPDENVVTITNGGGIRAPIAVGKVSKQDIFTVLPFGNTIAAVTVTGSELLEALEASTYCCPASTVGGFPQIEGMNISIYSLAEYDRNPDTYPDSTYYGPASINRVTIDDVNGVPFDPEATYVVLTNNFCAAGGDTYYAFKAASSQFDTGITMDYAVQEYVIDYLDGVIDETYAEPQGRITYRTKADPSAVSEWIDNLPAEINAKNSVAVSKAAAYYAALSDEEKEALPTGSKEKLEAAVAKLDAANANDKADSISKLAVDLVAAAAKGASADVHTKDSYDAFTAAFDAAVAVLNNKDAKKADIDAADAALLKAELVEKGDQILKVSNKKATVNVKKAKKVVKPYKVTGAKSTLKYAKVSGKKNFTVNSKTGKITVKKGTKKGTYTVKVKVTAPANDNFKAATKTVSVKIKVK